MIIHAIAINIVLQMNNVAGAPGPELERAQQEVVRLYRDIGVDVTWSTSTRQEIAPTVRVVLVPSETGDLRGRSNPVMGAAVVTDRGTGVAYIFYQQVGAQARQYDASVAMILASAIAHEVAHLLLPAREHSTDGLMRACWTRDDFHRAEQGQLRFSAEHAALIRTRATLQTSVEHQSRRHAAQ